jgi:ABC-2 type transport system permease protein
VNETLLIARRELAGYLRSWSGYIILALFLFIDGLLFNVLAMGTGAKHSSEVLTEFFKNTSGVTMGASVLLSMRLLAEERQTGTIQLLYSAPVRDAQIILGKYLSAVAFLALVLACTLYMPLLILVNGKISLGHLFAGYLGLLLLGSAVISIGVLGSSLARSQVVALVVSGAIVIALLVCWALALVTERPFSEIFAALALWNQHFQDFPKGMIHLRDVVYYGAVTYVFLFWSVRVLEARRWR